MIDTVRNGYCYWCGEKEHGFWLQLYHNIEFTRVWNRKVEMYGFWSMIKVYNGRIKEFDKIHKPYKGENSCH